MGAEGVGKSTLADYLVVNHGFVEISFAEPLRRVAVTVWNTLTGGNLTVDDTINQNVKETIISGPNINGKPPTPRAILQWFGTDIMRNMVLNDIWVNAAQQTIHKYINEGVTNFVISDCRFPNEKNAFKSIENVEIITIRIIPEIGYDELVAKAMSGHESGRNWLTMEPDIIVVNPKTDKETWCKSIVSDILPTE